MKDKIEIIGWPDGTSQVIIKGPNYSKKHCEDYVVIGEGKTDEEARKSAAENLRIMSDFVTGKVYGLPAAPVSVDPEDEEIHFGIWPKIALRR